jgi:multicomponent Na+:H+ antiporter subunit E
MSRYQAAPVENRTAPPRHRGRGWRAIGLRTIAATGFWWAMSEGRGDSWAIGAVTIGLAVAVSLQLAPPRPRLRGRWRAAIGFLVFFLEQSLRAGLQVAWLAFAPRAQLAPGMLELRLVLPPGPARYLLLATLSLLPGTLSVTLDGERLVVHTLQDAAGVEHAVRALEARIAPLFGLAR